VDYAGIKPNIKYYDFEFPDADGMLLFAKTRATGGSNYTHISIPSDYTIYDASYSHYGCNGDDWWWHFSSNLNVDGKNVESIGKGGYDSWGEVVNYNQYNIESTLTVGSPHTIEISYGTGGYEDHGSGGVATVIIYRSA